MTQSKNKYALQTTKQKAINSTLSNQIPNGYDLYCPAIWKQLHLNTKGDVFPCCEWTDIYPFGVKNLTKDTRILQSRNDVINGKIPKGCFKCVTNESNNLRSHRQDLIDMLGIVDKEYVSKDKLDAGAIEYIDLRMGNTCNFMCNFCSPNNSHLIGKEYLAVKNFVIHDNVVRNFPLKERLKDSVSKTINDDITKQEFLSLIPSLTNLKVIKLGGGEPFFQKKQLLDIIQKIPHKEKVTLRIITNCSVYDEEILQASNPFKEVSLALSVDATKRALEISRWKSNWTSIKENIDKFQKWKAYRNDRLSLSLIPTMSVYTILDLANLLEFASKQKIYTSVSFVSDPETKQINLINQKYLIKLKEKIQKQIVNGLIEKQSFNMDSVMAQLDHHILNNETSKNIIRSFWHYQKYFEANRNYRLEKELPDVFRKIKKI